MFCATLRYRELEIVMQVHNAIYPFPHKVEMAVDLNPHSLTLQATVSGSAGSSVPVSFGIHPYCGIPQLARNQRRLQLPPMRKLLLDARGILTGVQEHFGSFDALLGDRRFDDGFALVYGQSPLLLSGAGRRIMVTFLVSFPFAQVLAPKDKKFIALEPMTAPTSALTSGQALRVLAPGAQFRASFRITVHSGT